MRTRQHRHSVIAPLVLLTALGSACGGSADTSTSTTSARGSGGPTTNTTISRQQAVAASDASCARHNTELLPEPTKPEEVRPFLVTAMKAYRAELADIREIHARAGDFPELATIITDFEAYMKLVDQHLDELSRDPKPLSDPQSPYGSALARLREQLIPLGFTVCGGVGSGGSNGSSGSSAPATATPRTS